MKRFVALVGLAILLSAYFLLFRGDGVSGTEVAERRPSVAISEAESAGELPAQIDPVPVQSGAGDNNYSWIADATVTIPGSEPIPVVMKRIVLVNPPYYPTENFIDQYQSLATRARAGDAAAARMIAKALQICSLISSDDGVRQGTGEVESIRTSEKYCKGVSEDLVLEAEYWARLSAEGGDYLGIQTYAHLLGAGPERLALMQEFWNNGKLSALPTLSGGYFEGKHSAEASAPDYIKAYAYHLIYAKVQESARNVVSSDNRSAPARVGTSIAVENHLRYLGGFLSPRQQLEAEVLAAQLLSQNANCCIGSF